MSTALILGITAFFTSLIAAIIGFGGGMLLIAILPIFIAPALVIPLHGVTQLASNASRATFSWRFVQWALLPPFLAGSIIGSLLFGVILLGLPTTYIPCAIGLYLLLNLWCPPFTRFISQFDSFYLIGALQTGLGLIVGTTGPLSLSKLTKTLHSKDEIVATSAVFMTISHIAKIPVFMLITHLLWQSMSLAAVMVSCAIIGSFIGTRLRLKTNNTALIAVIKWLLSLLALNMIYSTIVRFF
ncbi:sulfite exporter TauE/SafE family protein [Pseudoalteromonas sp. SMS1]|uniref:sulfite exporter TauE/SafE family protein n=1 Tax=Pseudoalteromonas sp. SMS1 TaxID=2908894 RepID=UPI001F45E941|nr:sulfite exporter TauE/SafE family protein [Pseudoalteromonas sp. SMS1]MCF2860131.1 sulfite exporter TauE/SafE family protein [Pseudoalteromonas sp. SMS1]